jgi:DNA-binding transcriptional LysR family regulator
MIDVRKLRLLAALQRLGTIAAVAEEMHLSAPGVSMQITAFEKELGIRLTQRHGRRLVLTSAGAVLAAHGNDILGRLSLAEIELEALRAGTIGRYTVTAFPSAARTLVADACRQVLSGRNSSLDLRITTLEPEPALDAIASGNADIAVIHSYSNVPRQMPRGIDSRSLGSEPVWLATPSSARTGAADGRVDLSDYAASTWVAPTDDVTCFSMMERACGLAGFRPEVVAESMDFAVQLELVAAGVGVALIPALTIAAVPAGVDLHEMNVPVRRSIALATRTPDLADPGLHNLALILEDAATNWLPVRPVPANGD